MRKALFSCILSICRKTVKCSAGKREVEDDKVGDEYLSIMAAVSHNRGENNG